METKHTGKNGHRRTRTYHFAAALLALGMLSVPGLRAQTPEQRAYVEGLAEVQDVPGLPRVLLIGDSISIDYTVATRKRLEGQANVHHIPVNGGNTELALQHLDEWLGAGKWDVIHFNWGLHDLIVRPNGEHAVPLTEYEKNLREIVRRLKLTGALLVWATTTPVPEVIKEGPNRKNADVIAYNDAALSIMRENHILVNDLYNYIRPRLAELQNPGNVHFTAAGSEALAEQVSGYILVVQGLAPVTDKPGLPRVLLIGDSISIYYTVATRRLLQDQADVHHIPDNGGNTEFGLKKLDEWLGTGKWDVIHFNWGLHDLLVKSGGQHAVPLPEYEQNLRELVRRLKLTGARLIWATTTPVPDHIREGPNRRNSDAIAYNAAAMTIIRENYIPVDDLYNFVLPRWKELQEPEDVHFNRAGSEALAGQVAASIRSAITIP